MQLSKHVLGPWFWSPVDSCTVAIVDEDGTSIFDMTATENTTGHNAIFNNAALVASAPAMLKTLHVIVEMLLHSNDMRPDALHAAREVIARATGETYHARP